MVSRRWGWGSRPAGFPLQPSQHTQCVPAVKQRPHWVEAERWPYASGWPVPQRVPGDGARQHAPAWLPPCSLCVELCGPVEREAGCPRGACPGLGPLSGRPLLEPLLWDSGHAASSSSSSSGASSLDPWQEKLVGPQGLPPLHGEEELISAIVISATAPGGAESSSDLSKRSLQGVSTPVGGLMISATALDRAESSSDFSK